MVWMKAAKSHYSEAEAASELGVTVDQLRLLIRRHVIEHDEEMANVSHASFQPSDLLLLRLLAGVKGKNGSLD
jgi:hypothetical protein